MALSDEWEEEHLTPGGWVSGSYKHDFGKHELVEVPADAVLTVRRHVSVGAIGATPRVSESETLLTENKEEVSRLLAKFGKPTFSC